MLLSLSLLLLVLLVQVLGAATVEDYERLGVQRGATAAEVRNAYLRQSRRLHPDKNNNSESATAAFQALGKSYKSVLEEISGDSGDGGDGGDGAGVSARFNDMMKMAMGELRLEHTSYTLAQLYTPTKTVSLVLSDGSRLEVFRSPDLAVKAKRLVRERLGVAVTAVLLQGVTAPHPLLRSFSMCPNSFTDVLYHAVSTVDTYNTTGNPTGNTTGNATGNATHSTDNTNTATTHNTNTATPHVYIPGMLTGRRDERRPLTAAERLPACPCGVTGPKRVCYRIKGYGIYSFRVAPRLHWGYGDMIVVISEDIVGGGDVGGGGIGGDSGSGSDSVTGDVDSDVTTGYSAEHITTGHSDDHITTGYSDDHITTGYSDDHITTGDSAEQITTGYSVPSANAANVPVEDSCDQSGSECCIQ